jgi:hypothetical protein
MTPREEADMDIGATANATGRTTPVWGSPLRIAGILLPLAAGLVCAFIDQSLLLVSWIPFTVAAVSTAFVRSWWAVLITPAALSIGTLFGLLAAGSGPNDITDPSFAAGLTFFALLALLPAATGAAIGASLGKEIQRVTAAPRFTHS